jgi:hypothetical protein
MAAALRVKPWMLKLWPWSGHFQFSVCHTFYVVLQVLSFILFVTVLWTFQISLFTNLALSQSYFALWLFVDIF